MLFNLDYDHSDARVLLLGEISIFVSVDMGGSLSSITLVVVVLSVEYHNGCGCLWPNHSLGDIRLQHHSHSCNIAWLSELLSSIKTIGVS